MTSPSASRTLASPTARSRPPLPRSYLYWLAGAQASVLGDAVLSFALGWAAAGHGGRTAALVLTAVTVPRTLLLLPGGAVADRFGARRVLITGDAVLLAATLALAATLDRPAAAPWLLVLIAAVTGTVDAFHLPATGSMPRRLVSGDRLPRALAVRQAAGQAAALLGAPLGAVLVSASGLRGAALADAATFAVVLAVLVRIRPADAAAGTVSGAGPRGGTAGTVRRALADPVLRPALLLTAAAAGGLLPVVSLLGPLLARQQGWGAAAAGAVAGGQSLGVVAVALLVARRGPLRRIGVGAALGLVAAAPGIALLAAAPAAPVAVGGAVVAGTGSGMFACHLGPLVLNGAPETHLSRIQALLTLVQSLALVLANGLLGLLADGAGAATATAVCAAAVLAAGASGLGSASLRGARHG